MELDVLLTSLAEIAHWKVMSGAVVGVLVGIIVAVTPGLTGVMAVNRFAL